MSLGSVILSEVVPCRFTSCYKMGSWPAPQRLILWWLIHNTGPGGCMGSGRTFDFMLGELPSSAGGSRRWSWSVCKDIESFTGQRRRCRALQADGTSCSALRVLLFNWCWCWLFQQPFFFAFCFHFQRLVCVLVGGVVWGAKAKGDLKATAMQSGRGWWPWPLTHRPALVGGLLVESWAPLRLI